MRSRHLVDAELLGLIEGLPQIDLDSATLGATRDLDNQLRAEAAAVPLPTSLMETQVEIPGLDGAPSIPGILLRPRGCRADAPAILYVHGGGFVAGSAERSRPSLFELAENCSAVLAIDYRLAPETTYPGAIEDCYAALAWLHASAPEMGGDAPRIGIMGVSAGGGLAASLAILARDRGEFAVAFQILVFPMLDDRTGSGVTPGPLLGEFMWTAASNRFGWEALLGGPAGGPAVSAYAAPAREQNFAMLPATHIFVGTLDLFLEENLDFATRLARAGVPMGLHVYPGAIHAFMLAREADVSRRFARDLLEVVKGFARLAPAGATS